MPLAGDGGGAGGGVGSSTASFTGGNPITTTVAGDLIVIDVYSVVPDATGAIAAVTNVSATNITGWTKKQSITNHAGPANSWNNFERWYGIASGVLSSENVTVTFDRSCDSALAAIAYSGYDPAQPFDSNANASKQAGDTGFSQPTVTGISTSFDKCGIMSAVGVPNNDAQTGADIAGTSVGIAANINNSFGTVNCFYSLANVLFTSGALNNQSADFTAGGNPNTWLMLVDAIKEAPPGGSAADMMGQIWT